VQLLLHGGSEDVSGTFLAKSPSFQRLAETFDALNLQIKDYLEIIRWYKAGERGSTSVGLSEGRLVTKVEPLSAARRQGVHAGWIEISIGFFPGDELKLSKYTDERKIRQVESHETYFIKYAVPRGAKVPLEKRACPGRRLISSRDSLSSRSRSDVKPVVRDPDVKWRRQKRRKPLENRENPENRYGRPERLQRRGRPRVGSLPSHLMNERQRRHSDVSEANSLNSVNSHASLVDAYHSLQRKKMIQNRRKQRPGKVEEDNESVRSDGSHMSLVDAYEALQRKKKKRLIRQQRLKRQRFRSVQIVKKSDPKPVRNRKQNLSCLLPSQAEILSQIDQIESQIEHLISDQELKNIEGLQSHRHSRESDTQSPGRGRSSLKSHRQLREPDTPSPGRGRSNTDLIYRQAKQPSELPPSPLTRARARTEVLRSESSSSNDANLCVICLDKPKSIVLVPCGHVCICSSCSRLSNLTNCPICRDPVNTMLRVYF